MIQVIERKFEDIFCFLTSRKCYYFHVDKTTIQVVQRHLKVIFCLLTSRKFDLD